MLSKLKNTLAFRIAFSVFVCSFILTLAASTFFYQQIYTAEINEQRTRINQLASTVESSAAIAAYLTESELALEVIRGLVKNDVVDVAMISGESGFSEKSGELSSTPAPSPMAFPLPSPFIDGEQVGQLSITPNQKLIEINARNSAALNSLVLFAYAAFIIFLVAFLVHRQLTQPLTRMKRAIDDTRPGIDTKLAYAPKNTEDEIGLLVKHSNNLLTSIHETLEREKQLRKKIEKVERRFRLLFEQASVGIALITPEGKIELCNESFDHLVRHYSSEKTADINTVPFTSMFVKPEEIKETLHLVCTNDQVMSGDFRFKTTKQKERRWFHCLFSLAIEGDGKPLIEVVMYDISERAKRENQYRFEAEFDPLTSLYNRRAAERYMIDALSKAQSVNHQCAFILIDLDHFKPINDTYGHDAGDLVLIEIAKRLKDSVRNGDLICRWGGDEFLVILRQGHGHLMAEPAADAILNNLTKPIDIGQLNNVTLGASMGIVLSSKHGLDRNDLLKKADDAMYLTKLSGRNGYCISGQTPRFL